jgi:hypothetical protein
MKKINKSHKVNSSRIALRKQKQPRKSKKQIEREYQQIFTPHPLPFNGIYTDSDSLEQPSALKYVDSTTTPVIEVFIDPRLAK